MVNGKVYIGKTKEPFKRIKNHKANARSRTRYKSNYLYNAIRKYGIESFKFELLLSVLNIEYMNEFEIEIIKQYNSIIPNGYNLTAGGDGTLGIKMPEETKRKISEKNKGKIRSEQTKQILREYRLKQPDPMIGRKHSEESKKKMSLAKIGKKRQTPITEDERRRRSASAPKPKEFLQTSDVIDIKILFKHYAYATYEFIKKTFNISYRHILYIKNGKIYKNINITDDMKLSETTLDKITNYLKNKIICNNKHNSKNNKQQTTKKLPVPIKTAIDIKIIFRDYSKIDCVEISKLLNIKLWKVKEIHSGRIFKDLDINGNVLSDELKQKLDNFIIPNKIKNGSKNAMAKLNEDNVKEIKKLLSEGKSLSFIAKIYGVDFTNISMIKRGLTWKHVK